MGPRKKKPKPAGKKAKAKPPRPLVKKSGEELSLDASIDYVRNTCLRMGVDVVEEILKVATVRNDEGEFEHLASDRLRALGMILPYVTSPQPKRETETKKSDNIFNITLPNYGSTDEKQVNGKDIDVQIKRFD